MALNIAVPSVPLYGILDGFGFLSPHYDNTASKLSASPIESESSGISSLDSDDAKEKQLSSPSPSLLQNSGDEEKTDDSDKESEKGTDTERDSEAIDEEIPEPPGPENVLETETDDLVKSEGEIEVEAIAEADEDEKTAPEPQDQEEDQVQEKIEEVEETGKIVAEVMEDEKEQPEIPEISQPEPPKDFKIVYENRDILDLGANITDSKFQFCYAVLPTNNLNMFFANRSQYHRLGANGSMDEFSNENCKCCDFYYPMIISNNVNNNAKKSSMMIPNNNNNLNNQYNNNNNNTNCNSMAMSLNNFIKNNADVCGVQPAQAPQQHLPPITNAIPITKKSNNLNMNLNLNQNIANKNMFFNNGGNGNLINYFDNQKSTKINNFNYNGNGTFPNNNTNTNNSFMNFPSNATSNALTLLNLMNRNANGTANTSNNNSAAALASRFGPTQPTYPQNNCNNFQNMFGGLNLYKQF